MDKIYFTHALYGKCQLMPNSMLNPVPFPLAICYIMDNSMIIRVSSCLDANFRPSDEQFEALGYISNISVDGLGREYINGLRYVNDEIGYVDEDEEHY